LQINDGTSFYLCEYDSSTVFPEGFDPVAKGLIAIDGPAIKQWPSCYDEDKNCDGVNFALIPNDMWRSVLNDASFVESNWEGVGFGGSQAKYTNFTKAKLRGSSANHIPFDNSVFVGADLSGTNFESSGFKGVDLTGATITEETNLNKVEFDSSTKFPDGNDWMTTDFFSTDFKGMKLLMDYEDVSDMDFSASVSPRFESFAGASFHSLTAHHAKFQGNDFTGAWMQVMKAEGVDFTGANLSQITSQYSSIRWAILKGTKLIGAKLESTNLSGCNLVGADLTNLQINDGTSFYLCEYDSSTVFPEGFDPVAKGLIAIDGPAIKQWPSCYDEDKNCDGVNFALIPNDMWRSVLNDASFVESNWEGVGFGGSQAKYTNFTKAKLRGSSANHIPFDNSVFVGADLSGTNFESSGFKGVDLTGATITEETNLNKVEFDSSTKFPDGNDWMTTDFFSTDFKGMKLLMDYEDVSDMDFSASVSPRFESFAGASFHSLTAHHAKFQGNDFTGAWMQVMKAEGVDFTGANLSQVTSQYSSLRFVVLTNATLDGTNFQHTNLGRCKLFGTKLQNTIFDETTNLSGCRYDDFTIFPKGFIPEEWGLSHIDEPTLAPTPIPTIPELEDLMSNTLRFDSIQCFPLGMNLGSVNYYSHQWTFKNAFAESGGCCWPAHAKVDNDGNLLEVPSEVSGYWIEGRNIVYRIDGKYLGGTYVFRAEGEGRVELAWDIGAHTSIYTPTGPEGVVFNVTPSAAGVEITIRETSSINPVKNISFMLQDYEQSEDASPFSPKFIETISGMQSLRFMDMGRTNNNNIVNWNDRNTKTSFSQSRVTTRVWDVVKVSLPLNSTHPYIGPFAIELTTGTPHDLYNGQTVEFEGLTGTVTVLRVDEDDYVRDLSHVGKSLIEVTGPSSFLISVGEWWWTEDYVISEINHASANEVVLTIYPGVAYEYMLELSYEINADPWICVPHLATDDFVEQLARLVAQSDLGPTTTVFIELSNEVWNRIFTQQWHAEGMKRKLNLASSSEWYGARSSEIFKIFEDIFGSYPESPKLNRVLASQYVSTSVSKRVIQGAGGPGSFDSLAIAPYFGVDLDDLYVLGPDGKSVEGITVDDVLELCVQNIFGRVRDSLVDQRNVATDNGGKLVAYEGGQHLGGGGVYNGMWMADQEDYQALMIATNRDPRIHNLYQGYFKLWGELVGGLFETFSFIGAPSKYGSWGAKENYFKDDSVEESPKWASVKGLNDFCLKSQPLS